MAPTFILSPVLLGALWRMDCRLFFLVEVVVGYNIKIIFVIEPIIKSNYEKTTIQCDVATAACWLRW